MRTLRECKFFEFTFVMSETLDIDEYIGLKQSFTDLFV